MAFHAISCCYTLNSRFCNMNDVEINESCKDELGILAYAQCHIIHSEVCVVLLTQKVSLRSLLLTKLTLILTLTDTHDT